MADLDNELFGPGVVQIDPPRPEDDAASAYMQVVDAQNAAADDAAWDELLWLAKENDKPANDTSNTAKLSPEMADLMGVGGGQSPTPDPARDGVTSPNEASENRSAIKQKIGSFMSDLWRGATETPQQTVAGVIDAFGETEQFLSELTGVGVLQVRTGKDAGNGLIEFEHIPPDDMGDRGVDLLFESIALDPADSVTGGFVRATAQFLTGFVPALKGAKALGVKGSITSAMAAGAVADAVVFDPHEERLSTFLNQVPALEPFVSDYLADNNPENESSWEGRMKNAIEGAGLGITAEAAGALFRAFKYYKAQRRSVSDFDADSPSAHAQAGRDAMRDAARAELVQDIPDEALAPLGLADGPLITKLAPDAGDTTKIEAYLRTVEADKRAARSLERNNALSRINAATEAARQRMGVGNPDDAFDALLDAVRGGVSPSVGGARPVSAIVKELGGIDPKSGIAAELKRAGITSRTHPGLFRKGGLQNLDNIPISEQPIFAARNLDDGNGYVPETAWVDALKDEAGGDPWRTLEEQARFADEVQPIQDLAEELDRLGIDATEMSNANIRARINEIIDEEDALAREFAPEDAQSATLDDVLDAEMPDMARPEAEGAAPPEGKVFINHARINSPDDVKAVLQELADMDAEAIDAKRRGVVSNEQTIKESSQEYRDLDDLIGRPPGPMSAAQATAARRLLVSSGEQIVELAKRASAPNASPADIYNFRRAMSVHYAIQSEVIAARAETARALQAWAIPAGATPARSQMVNDLIMQSGGAGDIQSFAKVVGSVGENPTALNTMARELGRGKFGRALYQVWINGILSSPKTLIVNVLGNALVAAYSIPERYLAASYSKAFADGEVSFGEANAHMFGLVKGVRDGLRLVKHGTNAEGMEGISDVFDHFGKQEIHVSDISADAFGLDPRGGLGWGLDMIGKGVNIPGSILAGTDKFFKSIGYRMELNALAYRQAASEGLEGEEAAARIADILLNPPEHLQMRAIDVAHYRSFTNDLGKVGTAFTQGMNKMNLKYIAGENFDLPVGRLIVPFIRTPTNIVKYTFARTPLAYMSASIRADIRAGGAKAAQAHARVALGSMVMMAVSDMTLEGTISGRGPSDPRIRAAKMATGWRPYSIKIGDRWYQYSRLDPIAMMVGLAADFTEISSNANGEDAEMIATAAVLALANNLSSKTYMSGMYDFIGAVDPGNPTNDPGKYLSDFAGSMTPFSSFLRSVSSSADTISRETRGTTYDGEGNVDPVATWFDNTLDNVRRQIPGMGADLPPRRDLFGEPIDRASGLGWGYDFLSPIASRVDNPDPVTQVILDNQIRISSVPRRIDGISLTAEQYSEFSRLSGQPLKEHLDTLIKTPGFQRLSEGPDGMKAEIIRSTVNTFRKRAKAIMYREFPELQRLRHQRMLERAQTLQGEPN